MSELVHCEFVVGVPLHAAWDRPTRVEEWPSWAKHIKRVRLRPAGPLTETSEGSFRLAGGARSTFRMGLWGRTERK